MKYLLFILQFNLIFSNNICEKLRNNHGSIQSNAEYSHGHRSLNKFTILGRLVLNNNYRNLKDDEFEIIRSTIEDRKFFFFAKYHGQEYKLKCEPGINDEEGDLISIDNSLYVNIYKDIIHVWFSVR